MLGGWIVLRLGVEMVKMVLRGPGLDDVGEEARGTGLVKAVGKKGHP